MGSVCCINRKEIRTDLCFNNNNLEPYYPTMYHKSYYNI